MTLFKKTLREVELENQVAGLQRRIYELECKSGLFQSAAIGPLYDASPVQEISLHEPLQRDLTAIVTITSRLTERFGLEVQAWGRTEKDKSLFMQYFVERDKFNGITSHHDFAPYLIAELHEQFLRGLAHVKELPHA